jgi:hypothetical protein
MLNRTAISARPSTTDSLAKYSEQLRRAAISRKERSGSGVSSGDDGRPKYRRRAACSLTGNASNCCPTWLDRLANALVSSASSGFGSFDLAVVAISRTDRSNGSFRIATVAADSGYAAVVHRAGQPVGERILRIVQREAARRMPERGDFLFAERSPGGYRNVAETLQHHPPTQRPRLSSPRTAQLDHGCLDRPTCFACEILAAAGLRTASRL